VERFLPKRQHLVEFVTPNDNRTDFHFSAPNCGSLERKLTGPRPEVDKCLKRQRYRRYVEELAGAKLENCAIIECGGS
jgi:hypothetical protein